MTQKTDRLSVLASITGLILLLAAVVLVRLPGDTLIAQTLQNELHIPGFLLIGFLSGRIAERIIQQRLKALMLAAIAALALAVISEWLQGFTGREISIDDLLRDSLGVLSGLLVYAGFSRLLAWRWVLLLVVLLLARDLMATAGWFYAYWQRDRVFPVLLSCNNSWEQRFIGLHLAKLSFANGVCNLDFEPGRYPGITLKEPYPDWRGMKRLILLLRSEAPAPIELVVRIHDRWHDNEYRDRFNRKFLVTSATQKLSIRIDDIRQAHDGRLMDMSAIRGLQIFVPESAREYRIQMADIFLE